MATTSALDPASASFVEAADVRGLFAHAPLLLVNIVNAGIVASVMWGLLPAPLLVGWVATMTALVAGRIVFAAHYARQPDRWTPARWANFHAFGSLVTGLAWGATGIVPLIVRDPAFHVLVAMTAAGMGAGALMLSFTHLRSFRAFVLAHSLPVALGLALHGGTTYVALAVMGVVFIGVLDLIAQRLNEGHRRTQLLQARLVSSEHRMRDFAEAASHWLWETDAEGRFTMVSDGIARVTGMSSDQFIGRRPTEVSSGDPERRRASSEIERHFAAREAFMDLPIEVPLDDGRRLSLTISARPVFGADGAFLGFRGTTRDVTDQRRAERAAEEMRRARDVAAAADELKTRFLASVSHELRTPLNAVIGFSEMMAKEMLGPLGNDRYRSYAANINDSGRHLLDLINDLLDMSRIELGHRRLAEAQGALGELVDPCVAMIRGAIPHGSVAVDDAGVERGIGVRADIRAMRQVIINLLSNAVRAAPPGSRVGIASARDADGALRIVVTDQGPGIPEDEREALFQPFSGAGAERPRRPGGTGLGLWISRSLVESHGGTLTLDADTGGGTRATIRLPRERVVASTPQADGGGTTAVTSISTRA